MTASGGAAVDATTEAGGGSAGSGDEDTTILDGDKPFAIAAVGDALRFLDSFEQQDTTEAARDLTSFSETAKNIAPVTTGIPIIFETSINVHGDLGSASCARAACTYQHYARRLDDGQLEVYTGTVSRTSAGATATISLDMRLSATSSAIGDVHLLGAFYVTPAYLDGVMQFSRPIVGGTTVDTLRFNQVARADPPTSGSIELDRNGPHGHYRTTILLP